jgi:hypothetical protein
MDPMAKRIPQRNSKPTSLGFAVSDGYLALIPMVVATDDSMRSFGGMCCVLVVEVVMIEGS